MKTKTAEEMFSDLSYDLVIDEEYYIKYSKFNNFFIEFNLDNKMVIGYDDDYEAIWFNEKELKAILQQFKERR